MDKLERPFRDPTDFKDKVGDKVDEIVDWVNETEGKTMADLEREVNLLMDAVGPRLKTEYKRKEVPKTTEEK